MTAMARLTTLLVAMWLGVTVSTVVDLEKRIIGGHECGPKERLYHVKLITNHDTFCGGSLISNRWILTAAHCFEPGRTFTAHIGVHPGPATEVPITDPPVIFNDGNQQHDLMLLRLPHPVVGITPVRLPDCQHPPRRDAVVQIAGHASTAVGPNNERQPGSSATLQCVDMDVIDCPVQSYEHWICASRHGVDICFGDSGGGVVYQGSIHGVIVRSHGTHACAAPTVFMDLCYQPYLNWIRATIARP